MTPEARQVWLARIKSFLWRGSAFLAVAFLGWLAQEIQGWNIGTEWQAITALLIGELTKYINVNRPWLKSVNS